MRNTFPLGCSPNYHLFDWLEKLLRRVTFPTLPTLLKFSAHHQNILTSKNFFDLKILLAKVVIMPPEI